MNTEPIELESYVEKHAEALGRKFGAFVTLKRGTFGPDGKRVRLANFEAMMLVEANGVTRPIFGGFNLGGS